MAVPIFQKALFKAPKWSRFDWSHENRFSINLGKVVPVAWYDMTAGQHIQEYLDYRIRFMPTTWPVMQRYNVDFIPMFIPYRLLQRYNDLVPALMTLQPSKFFNPVTSDDDRGNLPSVSCLAGAGEFGTLWDFLDYPTYTFLYDKIPNMRFSANAPQNSGQYPTATFANATSFSSQFGEGDFEYACFPKLGASESSTTAADWRGFASSVDSWQLHCWLLRTLSGDSSLLASDFASESEFWVYIKNVYGVTQQAGINMWKSAILKLYVPAYFGNPLASFTAKKLNLLPYYAYHLAVADWFLNTNVDTDPDSYLSRVITLRNTVAGSSSTWQLFDRLWQDDYFTSALPSPDISTQVSVPVTDNAFTIADLANANATRNFLQRALYAGKRWIDQIFAEFGVKPKDQTFQRCEVLGYKNDPLFVSEVLQTSGSNADGSLATPAGKVSAVNGGSLYNYKVTEPGILMTFMTVRPRQAYIDLVPKTLMKTDFYEFLRPDFAHVGEQAVDTDEIFFNPDASSDTVFAYQRRYAEYMFQPDRIHGSLKTTMRDWHSARLIDSEPALNTEFIHMSDKDDLNRVFNVQDESEQIVVDVYFRTLTSLPLERFINYHI